MVLIDILFKLKPWATEPHLSIHKLLNRCFMIKKQNRPSILLLASLLIFCCLLPAYATETARSDPSSPERIFVRQFRFVGNKAFPDEELRSLIHGYEGREVTAGELQTVKEILTQYYIDKGYRNAGAVIPDQTIKDNVITLEIVESHLTGRDVSGNQRLRDYAITRRLEVLCEPAAVRWRPAFRQTEDMMRVNVRETRPYLLNVRFNNHYSPEVGSYQGEISFLHRNLMGRDDILSLCHDRTEGAKKYSATYNIPLLSRDTMLSVGYAYSEELVVAEPFDKLEIESETDRILVSLRHLLFRTDNQYVLLFSDLQTIDRKTYLLGEPFSFAESDNNDNGLDITLLNFGQQWMAMNADRTVSIRSVFGFGLDAFGATVNSDYFSDGKYFSWFGDLAWLERLRLLDSHLYLRVAYRYADDALLSPVKVSVGGNDTVRGYREDQIVRDKAFFASLEWRVPVAQWRIPHISEVPEDGLVTLVPFIDYGWGRNVERTPEPDDISSIGLGAEWSVSQTIKAEFYWGNALRDMEKSGEYDLQDDGVHFEISFQIW